MRYVREKRECCGCRACEQVCPVKCITVRPDEEGFLYPYIDEERCINCGKCLEVCDKIIECADPVKETVYAVKNTNDSIRKESSSGGVFYELAMEAVRRGGKVFGAVFDKKFRVHQTSADTEETIRKFMGSKYVQSDTEASFQEVKNLLERKEFVLYSGTPCQIKGLKQFLNGTYDNLVCISLICHGVPSPMVWDRYVKLKKGHYAEEEIVKICFRDKADGWRNMNLKMVFPKSVYSAIYGQDIYFQGFNQNLFLRPACYQCRAKDRIDYADIIIGDFWGIENCYPELDDGWGTSCVIINTEKGKKYWDKIEDKFIVRECCENDVIKRNPCLHGSVAENKNRGSFFEELKATGLVEESIKDNLKTITISQEARKQYQYDILRYYLKKQISGVSIFDPVVERGFHNICLYAITDLTQLVACDLEKMSACELKYICDRNYMEYEAGIWGIAVKGQKDLISDVLNNEIDLIIICNPMRENDIFSELASGGVPQEKIISIISLVFR